MNGVGNALTEKGQQQICLDSAQVTDGYWFRADRSWENNLQQVHREPVYV